MMRSRIVLSARKHMNWEFSGARNNVLAGWQLAASWHPPCSSDLQNFASSRCCRLELLGARLPRLFGVFANASTKFTQPGLKPSLLGPHPILRDRSISVIYAAVNFALSKNNLPESHSHSFSAETTVHSR